MEAKRTAKCKAAIHQNSFNHKGVNWLIYLISSHANADYHFEVQLSLGHFNNQWMGMENFSNFSLKWYKSAPKTYPKQILQSNLPRKSTYDQRCWTINQEKCNNQFTETCFGISSVALAEERKLIFKGKGMAYNVFQAMTLNSDMAVVAALVLGQAVEWRGQCRHQGLQ